MSEATTAIKEFLRIEEQNIEEVTVPEILGQLSHHSAIDGPEDVRNALESLRESDDSADPNGVDAQQSDAGYTVQTLAEANKESFEDCIAVIEDVELLREYTAHEVETQTRQERIAATNQRIDEIQNDDEQD